MATTPEASGAERSISSVGVKERIKPREIKGPLVWWERLGINPHELDKPVVCWAGSRCDKGGVPGCFCAVEESYLSAITDPISLGKFCMGYYEDCPTWQAEKEKTWSAQRQRLIDQE